MSQFTAPRAFITGCAGTFFTPAEVDFLREAAPWGLILFRRKDDDAEAIPVAA